MKKILCFTVMVIVISTVFAQQPPATKTGKNGDPSMPTYLVNGVEMAYEKVLKINTATIESMDVYKGPEAVAKFGSKYKHGLVMVKLKKGKK